MAYVKVILFQKSFEKRLYQTYKKESNKNLILDIIFVEVQQRDRICRGSDQLYKSYKETGDYICKGS